MIRHILVAVNDSPPALGAARLAIALAADLGADLRAVTVVGDGGIAERLYAQLNHTRPQAIAAKRSHAAHAVLRYVAQIAEKSSVPCEVIQLEGETAAGILEQARSWPADLIVLGRSDLPGAGQPYVGTHTQHVLEFAEQPVLVVPPVAMARRNPVTATAMPRVVRS